MFEHCLQDIKTHETVCHIDADESGMSSLALHQWGEVHPIMCHQNKLLLSHAKDDIPVRSRSEADQGDVRGFRKSMRTSYCCKRGAQTLVNQKLQL